MNITRRIAQRRPTTAPPTTAAKMPGCAKNEVGWMFVLPTTMGLVVSLTTVVGGVVVVVKTGVVLVSSVSWISSSLF